MIEGTSDGGASWTPQYRGPDPVSEVRALDATHAVALAGRGCPQGQGSGCSAVVLSTSDGGYSWNATPAIHADVASLAFSTPGTGWAAVRGCSNGSSGASCPGEVLGTIDGGTRWSLQLRTGSPIVAVAGARSQVWAVEAVAGPPPTKGALGGLSPAPPLRIWHSTDAGAHWSIEASVAVPGNYGSQGTVAQLSFSAAPGGARVGLLSVFDPDTCAMHGCEVTYLYRSTDAGAHWSTVSPRVATTSGGPCGPGSAPLFATTAKGAFVATLTMNQAACYPPATTLVTSSDGGSSFQVLHSWVQLDLVALSFPGASQGWAAAAYGGGVIIHTTDGGRTWSQQQPAPAPTTGLDLTGPSQGWGTGTAADPGAVLRSSDGGATWTEVADLPGLVQGLSALSPSHAFVVEESSPAADWSLMATTDGGRSWRRVYSLHHRPGRESEGVASLQMLSPSEGVMVTTPPNGPVGPASGLAPATLLSTHDGGRTWGDPHPIPVSGAALLGTPDGVSFASPSTGWAVVGGSLLGTTDGGGHWSRVGTVSDSYGSIGVDRVTAQVGWVVLVDLPAAKQGPVTTELLVSTDDGARWRRYVLPATVPLSSSVLGSFLNASQGWVLAGGTVWHARL